MFHNTIQPNDNWRTRPDTINVIRDFGAVGDDTATDDVAIQAAITALGSTGGTIFLPNTTSSRYKITTPLLIPSTGVTLVGESGVRLVNHTASGSVIKSSQSSGLIGMKLENLTIDTSNGITGGIGIDLNDVTGSTFNNVAVTKSDGLGFTTAWQLKESTGGGGIQNTFMNCVGRGKNGAGNYGFRMVGTSNGGPTANIFIKGDFSTGSGTGVLIDGGSNVFLGTVVEESSSVGFHCFDGVLQNSTNNVGIGCYCEAVTTPFKCDNNAYNNYFPPWLNTGFYPVTDNPSNNSVGNLPKFTTDTKSTGTQTLTPQLSPAFPQGPTFPCRWYNTNLTGNLTITLSTSSPKNAWYIIRTPANLGGFTFQLVNYATAGGTKNLAADNWIYVFFDGTAWQQVAGGTVI